MLDYLQSHNYTPPPGIAGGKIFEDRERKLPVCDDGGGSQWREFDVYPPGPSGRLADRIVICFAQRIPLYSRQYSPDHFATFDPFVWGTHGKPSP
ncbi:ribonuclease domain-containing protein [Amycolatopsis nigrescens]|uniref:ribonuclease domain-containing protein n=1 Tax=Amycolatopsis nigrescens TaxID=381445 RepID=UPI003CCB7827